MRRTLIGSVARVAVGSIAAGFVLAAAEGDTGPTVSAGVWGVVVVGLVGAEVLRALGRRAPAALDPVAPLVGRRAKPRVRRPAGLTGWEALVDSATMSGRAARIRLVPRLRDLAARRLATGRGIDAAVDPQRAAAALGPAAWVLGAGADTAVPVPADPGIDLDSLEQVVGVLEAIARP